LFWAYLVLGLSFMLESASISLAIYQELKEARAEGLSFFQYLRESKDPTAKTVLFEDSAALLGILIAATGLYLTEHHAGLGAGSYWDGLASILIGVVLAIVAFALARTSRALLLGEAASAKTVQRIREAIESHPNVVRVIEILTMHLAPKQILINAHVNLRDELVTSEIERTIEEIEQIIRKAEPKVEMIFLETARQSHSADQELIPEHVG
jgi:divalent metal cation (Fe/Co/Zn/Cd) transporter